MKSKNPKTKSVKLSGMKGCTVNFAGATPEDSDGSNGDYETEMSIIGNLILSNYAGRSFSIRDFISLSRSLDVPILSVKKYYEAFLKEQLTDKRIVEIPTVMDDKTFVVI